MGKVKILLVICVQEFDVAEMDGIMLVKFIKFHFPVAPEEVLEMDDKLEEIIGEGKYIFVQLCARI